MVKKISLYVISILTVAFLVACSGGVNDLKVYTFNESGADTEVDSLSSEDISEFNKIKKEILVDTWEKDETVQEGNLEPKYRFEYKDGDGYSALTTYKYSDLVKYEKGIEFTTAKEEEKTEEASVEETDGETKEEVKEEEKTSETAEEVKAVFAKIPEKIGIELDDFGKIAGKRE